MNDLQISNGYAPPAPERLVRIAEIFGPTIQGEGRLTGTPVYFVRTGGCDYRCTWCDSLHAVLPEKVRELPTLDSQSIVRRIQELPGHARWVVLSGGNPALQDLSSLVLALQGAGFATTMETQGTVYRSWMDEVDHITVSPKGPSAQLTPQQFNAQYTMLDRFYELRRVRDERVGMAVPSWDLKIPVFDDLDLRFAARISDQFPSIQLYLSVGNDVGKDSVEDLIGKYRWLIDQALKVPALGDARIMPQLHVLTWGNERGR